MKEIKRSTKIKLLKSGACILVALVLIINTVFLYANNDGEEPEDSSSAVTQVDSADQPEKEETQEPAETPVIEDVPEAGVPEVDPSLDDNTNMTPEELTTLEPVDVETDEILSEDATETPVPTDGAEEMPSVEPSVSPTATPSITPEIEASISKTSSGIKGTGLDEIKVSFDTEALDKEDTFDIILSTDAEDISVSDAYKASKNGNKYTLKGLQKNAKSLTVKDLDGETFNLYAEGTGVTFTYDADKVEEDSATANITIIVKKTEKDKKEVKSPKTEFKYEDGRVVIQATASKEANLPQDAELRADYLAPGSAAYNAAAAAFDAQLSDELGASKENVRVDYILYDIYFVSDSEGRIEPEAGNVKIEMTFLTPAKTETEGEVLKSEVVHLKDSGEAEIVTDYVNMDGDGAITSMGFTQNSFSTVGGAVVYSEDASAEDADETEGETNAIPMLGTGTIGLAEVATVTAELKASSQTTEISRNEKLNLKLNFTMDNTKKDTIIENPTLTYQLPKELTGFPAGGPYTLRDGGTKVGTYTVSEDNVLTIQLTNAEWVNENSNYSGYINFNVEINESYVEKKDEIHIEFEGNAGKFDFTFEEAGISSNKTAYLNEKEGWIEFSLDVMPNKTMDITVTDVFSGDVEDIDWSSFKLFDNATWQSTDISVTKADNGFSYTIENAKKGVNYTIKYKVKLDEEAYADGNISNSAEWSWKGNSDSEKKKTDQVEVKLNKKWISKSYASHKTSDGYSFDWKIVVNDEGVKGSVAGKTITDQLSTDEQEYSSDITITGANGWSAVVEMPKGDGFEYTFPENGTTDENGNEFDENDVFTITYQTITTSDKNNNSNYEIQNNAEFKDGDKTIGSSSAGGWYPTGEGDAEEKEAYVSKNFVGVDANNDTFKWVINVDVTDPIENVSITDSPYTGWGPSYLHEVDIKSIVIKKQDGTILKRGTDYTVKEGLNGACTIHFNKLEESICIELETKFDSRQINHDGGSLEYSNKAELKWQGENEWSYKEDEATAGYTYKKEYNIKKENKGYDAATKTISWSMMINADAADSYLENTLYVLRDTLPENTTFVNGSLEVYKYNPTKDGIDWGSIANITDAVSWNVVNGILTINLGDSVDVNLKDDKGAYRGYCYEIKYKTKLNDNYYLDADGNLKEGEFSLVNLVDLQDTAGNILGKAEAEQKIKSEYFKKTSTKADNNFIKYTINVNPEAMDLLPNEEYLDLEDILPANLNLNVSEGVKVEGTDDYTVSYDSASRKLIVHVPDEVPCVVTYEAELIGEVGQGYTIANTVYLRQNKLISSTDTSWYQVTDTDGGMTGTPGKVKIQKVDADNLNKKLEGVKFELFKVPYIDNQISLANAEKVDEGYTDKNGELVLPQKAGVSIDADHLYFVKETKTISGYDPDDTPHYIVIKGQSWNNFTNAMNSHSSIKYTVISEKTGLNWTITNKKNNDVFADLYVKKTFNGGEFPADGFDFELKAVGGAPMPEEAENGVITVNVKDTDKHSFGGIKYTEEGEYLYSINEVVPDDAEEIEGSSNKIFNEIIYDATVYDVKVTVKNGVATVSYKKSTETEYNSKVASFMNRKEDKGSIEVSKIVGGTTTVAGPFYFVLTDSEGNHVAKEDGTTVYEISANGTVKIDGLAIGIYHLKETDPEGKEVVTGKEFPYAVTYSSSQIEVKPAKTTEFTITNTYYETEGSLPLTAHKSYNRSLLGNNFHFTVTENGKTILEADNDSQGDINFGSISYNGLEAEGDHIYVIREQVEDKDKKNGITYSETVYTLTVNVKDDGNHQLIPTVISLVDQNGNSVEIGKLEFKNEYKATGELNLTASKTVDGETPAEDEVFDFELWNSNADGDLISQIEAQTNTLGEISFKQIDYSENSIGTHYYLVREVGAKDGYILDTKKYLVKVIVSDNDLDGVLELTEEYSILSETGDTTTVKSVAFDNTYNPTEDSVVIKATKELKNGNISKYVGKFSFTLEGYGVTGGKETVSNTGENGTEIVFSEIKYGKSDIGKDYTYTITEEASNLGSVVTDDPVSVREVIVKVRADRNTGEIIATAEYKPVEEYLNDNGAVFHNEYHTSGSVELVGSKVLTGKDLTEGMFNFVVKEGDETRAKGTNDKDGNIKFTEITYDKAGTHVYTVSEVIPQEAKQNNNVLNGITYDARSYEVTVTLADDGQGKLKETITYNPEGGIVFENEYNVTPIKVTLEGTKTLTGRDMREGEFSFEVVETVDGEEKVVAKGSNEASKDGEAGSIVFSEIEYTQEGSHTYTVREVKGGSTENGVSYTGNTFEVVVTITDNGLGGLEKNVQYKGGKVIEFKNSYSAKGEVTLKAHKTVDGVAPAANENGIFTFEVLENGTVIRTAQNNSGDVEFEKILYTLNDVGPHTYTIREKRQDVDGYSYDLTEYEVEVVVSDGKYGELNVSEPNYKKAGTPVSEESVVFNNIKDGSTVIEASKELLGGGMLTDGMFKFRLTSSDDPGFEAQEVENTGVSIVFSPITYTRDDIKQTYHYTITEMPSEPSYIEDDEITTRNVSVTINEVNGKIVTSVVYEPVTKYPDDEGAVFHNTYSAVGHATITGTKELTGRDITSGEFTFELYRVNADNSETLVTETTNTVDNGKEFSFNDLEFTSVGTYTYRVKEKKGTAGGVNYDSASFDVTVVVTDNNDGTLKATVEDPEGGITFKNSYTARGTSITFEGTKNLTGRSLINEEFEFEVKDAEGNLVSTGKNNTNTENNIVFTPIQYTKAGTYVYTVSEKKPEGHVNGVYHGVTYDSNVFTVTVIVTDDNAGHLVAAIDSQNSQDIIFKNDYSTSKSFTLTASKTVDRNEPKEGEVFKFILTGGYGDKQENQTEITNNGSTITFDPIDYDQDDIGKTFTYTVTESQETLPGYKYDERIYTVEVTVTDVDLDGELEINPVYYEGVDEEKTQVDSIKFNNDYTPDSDEIILQATKKQEKGTLGKFWFILTSTDHKEGFEPQRKSNDGTQVKFDPITYTKADIDKTYHYIITEEGPEIGKLNGVTYDTARERHVTVEVKAVNGQIVATETYEVCDAHADDGNAAIFHNSYDAEGGFTPQGTKTLIGRDTDGGEFWFVVKEGDKVLQRVSSSAAKDGEAGKINFTEIKYELKDVGPHTYTVSEENAGGTINGVTYGNESYTITVEVNDNHNGTLSVVDTYSPEVMDKTMTFTNTYNAEIDYPLSGTKKLTGRDMTDGEFHFVVMEGDEQKATGTSTQATNGTATVINFTKIHYTLADLGEHTYTITEVNDVPKGVARNSQSFTVVVNVTDDNKNGTLTATIVSEKSDTVAFENTYTASVSLELEATKTVNDKAPTENEVFNFTLTGGLGDKTVNQSKSNVGTKVTFDAIQYDQNDVGKKFIYEIKESDNVPNGYHYDPAVYTVEVTVERDDTATNGLKINQVVKKDTTILEDQAITFNNTYPSNGEVQFVAYKDLKYGTIADGMFSFKLTDSEGNQIGTIKSNDSQGKVTFDKIYYTKSDIGNTYTYTITEEVDSSKTGYVTYDTELTRTVTVTVGEVNGEVKATSIVYSSNGKYEDDDKDNVAIFHNTYKAKAELTLEGTKKLPGRVLNDGEFEFMVIDKNKEKDNVVATGTNVGEKITFSTITYNQSQIGQTYTYEIKEKGELPETPDNGIGYDSTSYTMTVTVTDPKHDGHLVLVYSYPEGGLTFENTYTADGEIILSGTKQIDSRAVTDQDQFTFEVYEVVDGKEEATPVTTGTSTGSTITFRPISYTSLDDVRIHTYHVKEVACDKNGVKSTDVFRTVKVKVTDDKYGTLNAVLTDDSDEIEFTNNYHATGELQLEAWKTVNGEAPGNREFSFTLSNDKDSKTDTKPNTVDGHVVFDEITFTEADVAKSPITYTIKENIPTGEDAIVGMKYDQSEYKVTVTLTDDGNGNITVNPETIKYVKDDGQTLDKALFNNTYEADDQVVIEASKKLEGGALKSKQFTFILRDENGEEVEHTTNDGSKVIFNPIPYSLEDIGTYTYTIEEYDAKATGYTYDGTIFTVNVDVSENPHGGLIVTKEYVGVPENEVPQFVNEYTPKEIWISKVDAASSSELAGASMIITDDAGKVDSWVSDGTRHVFKADYDKTYTLTETAAPEGFMIAESITFRVDSDGVLWIQQADGSFVQQSDSVVTMVDMAAPVKTPDPTSTPTPENTPEPSTTPSVPENTPEPSATPGTTPEATATPGQTPAPEETPTPEETPAPDNTPNPVVTPGSNPVPTPRGSVLGARKVRMGGTQAAVLGARRGADFAVLGKRRRPSTGDSMALLIWIITMSVAMGGAITSSTLLSLENGRKRRRRR